MGTRRIIYAVALAGSAFFSVLYSYWFSWYLLVLILLLVPFDLIISLPGMLSRQITISAPRVLDKGANASVVVSTLHTTGFPTRCIKAWIRVSGDDFSIRRRFILRAERGSKYEIAIDTSRSGVTVFEARRIWTVSLIGLFSLPVAVNCRASVLVMPLPEKPPNTVALPRGVILRPKPGGGFSEDYDLRLYRKGDPIRSVHWKVSAKFDSLIIREPLVPPAHSRLIHAVRWSKAKERDLVLGRLRWVSNYLLKWELPFYVRLGDDGPVAEIDNSAQLADYLYRVLDGAADTIIPPASLPVRFVWVLRIDGKSPKPDMDDGGVK